MSAAGRSTPAKRSSWKQQRDPRQVAPLSKNAKRWLTTLSVGVMAAVLAYALYYWLTIPVRHAYLAVAPLLNYHAPQVPPNAFAEEDADALEQIVPARYTKRHEMQTFKDLTGFSAFIKDLPARKHDSLVVYLSGHGVSMNGTPVLLPSDAWDELNNLSSMCDMTSLLNGFAESQAKHKLLILDSGRLDSDPRLGLVVNEFPRLVEQHVSSRTDGLWVLLPADVFQTTQVDYHLRRSVFGRLVSEAFEGQADSQEDRELSLTELFEYVSLGLAPYGQTPLLLHAGQGRVPLESIPPEINLLRVASKPAPTPGSVIESARSAKKTIKDAKPKPIRPVMPTLKLTANLSLLAGQQSSDAPAKAEPGKPQTAPPTAPTAPADKPASSATPDKPASGDVAPAVAATPPAEGKEKLTYVEELSLALTTAWDYRDRLKRGATTGPWRPCDYAPHRWRALDAVLLDLERRSRGGDFYETTTILDDLNGLAAELGALVATYETAIAGDDKVVKLEGDDKKDVVRKVDVARQRFLKTYAVRVSRPAIASDATTVIRARQIFNSAVYEAPDFLRWQYSEVLVAGERQQLVLGPLAQFLELLAVLQQRLDALATTSFGDTDQSNLETAATAVATAHTALRASLELRARNLLDLQPKDIETYSTRQRQMEAVLSTPLLNSELRQKLLAALRQPSPEVAEVASKRRGGAVSPNPPWDELKTLLDLQIRIFGLAEPLNSDGKFLATLRESHRRLDEARNDEARWAEYRKVGPELQHSQDRLARKMRGAFVQADFAALSRGLWLVDYRDAASMEPDIHAFASLEVKRQRTLAFGPSAPRFELGEEWRTFEVPVAAIALGKADEATLKLRFDEQRMAVRRGNNTEDLRSDGSVLVPIDELTAGAIVLQARAKQNDMGGAAPPVQLHLDLTARNKADKTLQPPPQSIECHLPSPERIALRVQRIDSSGSQGDDGTGIRLEPFPNRDTAFQFWLVNPSGRPRKVSLELWAVPPLASATWAPGRLFVSGNQIPVEIRQELFKDVTARVLKMRSDLDPQRLLSQSKGISLPADVNSPVEVPFVAWPPGKKEPAAGEPAAPATPAGTQPGAAPPGPDISHGLLCVITDEEKTDRQWLEWIELRPLRPDKFLVPTVLFNATKERLQAEVAIREDLDNDGRPDKIPGLDKKPLVVDLQLDEAKFDKGAKNKQVLLSRAGETQVLFAAAIADGVKRNVNLVVDGYPRAFRYEVPCVAGGLPQVPVNTEAIRVTQLAAAYVGADLPGGDDARKALFTFSGGIAGRRAMFPAPAQELQVGFEVDAPPNAFVQTTGRDVVELRLLPDKGEKKIARFYSDRQATMRVTRLSSDGVLTLKSQVGDYSATVASGGLDNVRVDVSAALFLDGASRADALPVELLLDGAPPRVSRIANAKTVPGGKAIFLQAEIPTDDNLSGIQKVEIGIDKNQNRVLDKDDVFYPATPGRGDAAWLVEWDLTKLELAPGQRYELFARAFDRVGWQGKPEEDPAGSFIFPRPTDLAPKVFGVIKGTVKFKGMEVTKGRATLTLRVEEPERVIVQKAGDDGKYVLRGVPAGRHKLIVTGNFLGTDFVEQLEVEIPAVGSPEIMVDINISGK